MPKTDFAKLTEERTAATIMRDELSFLVGYNKRSNPEFAKELERILKQHEDDRCQDWL